MRDLLRSFSAITASDLLSRGSIFVFGVLLARAIGPSEFGLYGLFVMVFSYLWVVADGGCTNLGIKLVSQAQSPAERWRAAGRVVGTRLVSTGCVICLVLLVGWVLEGQSVIAAGWVLPGAVLLLANAIFMAWYARSVRDHAGYFAAYSGVALAFAAASIAVWRVPGLLVDAEGGMWGRSLAWLIGALAAGSLLFKGDLRRIARELRPDSSLYRSAVWLAVAALLSGLSPLLPMLVLSQVGSAEQLGWYSAAWQIQQVMLAGAAVLHMVFFPKIYREASASRASANKSYRLMILIAVTGSVAAVAIFSRLSQTVVSTLFGPDYVRGSGALAIVTVGAGAVLLRYVAELRVMIDGRTSQIFVAAAMSAAFCAVASFFFASDAFRASMAYVIGELVYTISLVLMAGAAAKPMLGLVAGFICSAVVVLLAPDAVGILAAILASAAALLLFMPRIHFETEKAS